MRRLGTLIGIMFLLFIGLPGYVLHSSPLFVISQSQAQEGVEEKVIKVDGMTCRKCEKAVEKEVKKVSGVIEVKADHKSGTCKVKVKAGTNLEDIKKAIEKAGYKPVGES